MADIAEQLKSLYGTHPICMEAAAEIEKLRRAAKAVCAHWSEFGPEYGFDETMEGLYRATTTPVSRPHHRQDGS